jgi:hypothetical protein
MDASWGYGREGIENDRETWASEKMKVNFEPL